MINKKRAWLSGAAFSSLLSWYFLLWNTVDVPKFWYLKPILVFMILVMAVFASAIVAVAILVFVKVVGIELREAWRSWKNWVTEDHKQNGVTMRLTQDTPETMFLGGAKETSLMLQALLDSFEIPEARRDITVEDNLKWLLRNMHINNGDKLGHAEARLLILAILRNHQKSIKK